MPNNWKKYKLGEFASLRKQNIQPKDFTNEIYIGLEHIGQGNFLLDGIGEASDVTSNKATFKSGDILYGKIRPYFKKVYRPKFSGICSTDILVVFSKNENLVDQNFLYQIIKTQSFTDKATETSTGTKMPRADWDSLCQIEFEIPPLKEQQAIAEILSALDDKIELNLQTNKTLEEMANALYKHWFVDFGPFLPPGRCLKDGGGPIPGFVESELGLIPEGWEAKPFFSLIDLLSGGTPKTSVHEYWGDEICWVSAKDIGSSNESFIVDTDKKITELGLRNSSTKILPEDTIIIVARGSVGKYGIISKPMAMNQSCYGLYSKGFLSQSMVFLITQNIMKDLLRMSYGSVFDTITTNTFNSINVAVPSLEISKPLMDRFDILFNKVKQNTIENQTLKQTRDYLLPKLISGEIRVKSDPLRPADTSPRGDSISTKELI